MTSAIRALRLSKASTIHELIRVVDAPGVFEDNLPDMLVNDFQDLEDLPDKLYLSDGSVENVRIVTDGIVSGHVVAGQFASDAEREFAFGLGVFADSRSGNGQYQLAQVIRSDGTPLSVGTNVWTTDRTFIGGGKNPILEHNLHLLDYQSTGSYTLIYTNPPQPDIDAPASAITALPATSFPQIPLTWTGTDGADGSGIAWFDIYVSDNGGPFALWLQHTPLFGAVYSGEPGHSYAFYSVAADLAGNSRKRASSGGCQHTVSRTNSAPQLLVGADLEVNEGTTVVITNLGD